MLGRPQPKLVSLALACLSGALFPLGFEPFAWWPLTVFAICGFFYVATESQNGTRALLLGWLFGLFQFGIGVSWIYVSIHTFGNAPAALAVLLVFVFVSLLAIFTAILAWVCFKIAKYESRRSRQAYSATSYVGLSRIAMLLTAAWMVYEAVISNLWVGFPWLLAGNILIDTPLRWLAQVLGVYGLSMMVVFVAATLRYSALNARILANSLIVLVGLACSLVAWTHPTGERKVALVQPNIALTQKWDHSRVATTLQKNIELSRSAGPVDLVLWSEVAVPLYTNDLLARLRKYEDDLHGADLLTGIFDLERAGESVDIYNAMVIYGDQTQVYRKAILVPFGEFVPFAELLRGLIGFFDLPMSSLKSDPDFPREFVGGDMRIAPAICYEIAFPHLVNDGVQKTNADVLVTVSEDSWFGESLGPYQHLQIARMRALEQGKYLLRATTSGITAVIAPDGSVQAKLQPFTEGVLVDEIQRMSGTTPFNSMLFQYAVLVISLLILAYSIARAFVESMNRPSK